MLGTEKIKHGSEQKILERKKNREIDEISCENSLTSVSRKNED